MKSHNKKEEVEKRSPYSFDGHHCTVSRSVSQVFPSTLGNRETVGSHKWPVGGGRVGVKGYIREAGRERGP